MMFRKPRSRILLGTLTAVFLVGTAMVAQQPSGKTGEQGSSMNMGNMKMDDMTKQCKTHCQKTTAAIDQTRKDIDSAKQSNDPAKMRAAFEQVDKWLSDMSQHMSSCMNMMDDAEMHGMGSGGKK